MDTEKWLPVVGWEGFYEVSDCGQVRSVERTYTDSRGHVYRCGGRVLRHEVLKSGHWRVWLNDGTGNKRRRLVHNVVLEAFKGPRPPSLHGLHKNDIPAENGAENLYWGTLSDNAYDKVRNGHDRNANAEQDPHGHLYSGPNLYIDAGQRRRACRACRNATCWAASRRRLGEAITDEQVRERANRRYREIMSGRRGITQPCKPRPPGISDEEWREIEQGRAYRREYQRHRRERQREGDKPPVTA